jgi:uncharacterized protein (TIGR03118 family)
MSTSKYRRSTCLLAFVCAVAAHAQYVQKNLVSDGFVSATTVDSHLVNPWGLAFNSTGPSWIANNGTSTSTLYNAAGTPFPVGNPLVVNVLPTDSAPTGLVFNGGTGFTVKKNRATKPALFIFATEGGQIDGWNPGVDPTHAIVMSDESDQGAIYKGAALMNNKLYVTNFSGGTVDVYNSLMQEIGHFTDHSLPTGYAPFGIEPIGHNILAVTFALKSGKDDVSGPGHGFVDLFSEGGALIRRFASRGALNSPWGIAVAPNNFGSASNDLLIGNFGDGRINVYTMSGVFVGPLKDTSGNAIQNDGLWSIRFGNGGLAGPSNTLLFTAGLNHESDGLFGSIALAP